MRIYSTTKHGFDYFLIVEMLIFTCVSATGSFVYEVVLTLNMHVLFIAD